jgi:hypothetical protein
MAVTRAKRKSFAVYFRKYNVQSLKIPPTRLIRIIGPSPGGTGTGTIDMSSFQTNQVQSTIYNTTYMHNI